MPDILRLWDSLFADEERFKFLIYVATAMLVTVRERLLAGDFADNLKLLQAYPQDISVDVILSKAIELRHYDPAYHERRASA